MSIERFLVKTYHQANPWQGIADVRALVLSGKPVVVKEAERYIGILDVHDLAGRPHRLIADVVSAKPAVPLTASMPEALNLMMQNNHEHLPVMQDGEFKGVIGRTALIKEYMDVVTPAANEQDRIIELEKILSIKDKFLLILGHDIRNLFSQVLGSLELLQHKHHQLDEGRLHALLRLSKKSAEQVSTVFDNIIQWSKAGTGQLPFNPQPVSLLESIRKVTAQFQLASRTKGITLKSHLESDNLVLADPNMLTCILLNLVYNAIKFTPQGGNVLINAEQLDNHVVVMVSDSGIGIPPDRKQKLFLRPQSTQGTEQESGSGIGLILCKEFVEKHGGQIWLESELGMGTQVKFSLPQHQPD